MKGRRKRVITVSVTAPRMGGRRNQEGMIRGSEKCARKSEED